MIPFPRPNFLLAAAAVAFLPAACTGEPGEATGSAAAEIAACPLLSPAELEQAVGTAMGEGEERAPVGGGENAGRMTACGWTATSDEPGAAIVTLLVWSWPAGSGAGANYLESFRKAAEEYKDLPTPEPVSLGQEALWDGTSTHVRSGDVSFSIAVSEKGFDAAKSKDASMSLAEVILGRL